MSFFELLLIAAGLSMDAFAVALSDGMTLKSKGRALLIAAVFGTFQAAMPLLGFFLCTGFAELISAYGHFAALLALGFIGGKMIIEGVGELRSGKSDITPAATLPEILVQGVATSIDALLVGCSLAGAGAKIFSYAAVIGATTFVLSLAAALCGRRLGTLFGTKATIAGGIILVIIGVKTAVQHIFFC